MNEILVAIIIVAVLLLVLMLILTFMVKRINSMLKKIYVDKLQEYDFLINDKEERAIKLNSEIEEKEKEYEGLKNKIEEFGEGGKVISDKDEVILPTDTDYEDENILEGYKKIKSHFSFDKRKIINEFVRKCGNVDDKAYKVLSKIRSYFTYKTMYKISSYQIEEQRLIVNNLLTDEEKSYVSKLLNRKKFSVKTFVKRLDDLILNNNPTIKVYVGNKNENFDDINANVKTFYDKNIVDGFKIEYKGRLYDFSI